MKLNLRFQSPAYLLAFLENICSIFTKPLQGLFPESPPLVSEIVGPQPDIVRHTGGSWNPYYPMVFPKPYMETEKQLFQFKPHSWNINGLAVVLLRVVQSHLLVVQQSFGLLQGMN